MTEKTESNGKKESVKLRERLLEDGTKSLYLDIQHNGKRSREFLKLYLLEGTSKIIKEQNRQTMAQAEAIRAQRQIELQSGSYEVLHQFKPNTYFLAYYRKMCEEHFQSDSEGNWGIWHISGFRSRSSIFRILNKHGITLNRGPHSGPIRKRSERQNESSEDSTSD